MADRYSPFDKEFHPEIRGTLNTMVNTMQEKMGDAQLLNVDQAEKLLDDACNDCIKTFQSKMEDIKAATRKVKPDPSSPTYIEDNKKYTTYIQAVAVGVTQSKNLFHSVFQRIRNIVTTVLEWIKNGGTWVWSRLIEAFDSVKSLWEY